MLMFSFRLNICKFVIFFSNPSTLCGYASACVLANQYFACPCPYAGSSFMLSFCFVVALRSCSARFVGSKMRISLCIKVRVCVCVCESLSTHCLCVCLLSSQHFVSALPFLSTVCLFQLRYPVLAPACSVCVSMYVCVCVSY